ncbi:MAG: hypothetical protein J0H97_02590 [Alphaproteobacteria bacterium]|jgi:hypothetical protein|nr:hypothetical protein [Alphaproteobacteria bacterium]
MQEVRKHEEAFHDFGKRFLFAIIHIGVVLGCISLAFLANALMLAVLIGLSGTLALIRGFLVSTRLRQAPETFLFATRDDYASCR